VEELYGFHHPLHPNSHPLPRHSDQPLHLKSHHASAKQGTAVNQLVRDQDSKRQAGEIRFQLVSAMRHLKSGIN